MFTVFMLLYENRLVGYRAISAVNKSEMYDLDLEVAKRSDFQLSDVKNSITLAYCSGLLLSSEELTQRIRAINVSSSPARAYRVFVSERLHDNTSSTDGKTLALSAIEKLHFSNGLVIGLSRVFQFNSGSEQRFSYSLVLFFQSQEAVRVAKVILGANLNTSSPATTLPLGVTCYSVDTNPYLASTLEASFKTHLSLFKEGINLVVNNPYNSTNHTLHLVPPIFSVDKSTLSRIKAGSMHVEQSITSSISRLRSSLASGDLLFYPDVALKSLLS